MSDSEYKDPEWENSLELKKALKLVLKYEIHCLLRRLSETGEESVVITASAAEGSASHLCSKKGEDFLQIESLDVVKHNFLSYCKVASEPSFNKKSSLENFMSQSQPTSKEQYDISPKEQSSEEITIMEPVSIKSEPIDIDLDLDLQASELTECPQPQEQKTISSVGRESSQAHRGGGRQQAVSRQSSYNSNHIDQPFTVGLANTGDTLISLPVCNFDVEVDKDQPKNRFGEMELRSAGLRRFRTSIERRGFRMDTQSAEEFACQKELTDSVNPSDSTSLHSKQHVYLEGAWSVREDSNYHLKSEKLNDIVSVDTTDGLSLGEQERLPADSREFTKSFPIQQPDVTSQHSMFNLQADLCVAGIAHVNNNLSNLEALQTLSQRTFSSSNVILRNETIPTGLSFSAPGTSINRATINRHSGRSRVDYTKVTPGRHVCPYCPVKDFRDRRTLQRHIRKHTGEKPFHCNICGRGLGDSRSLFEHVQLHTGNLPYKCKLCGKAFRHHNTFNAHKKKHFT